MGAMGATWSHRHLRVVDERVAIGYLGAICGLVNRGIGALFHVRVLAKPFALTFMNSPQASSEQPVSPADAPAQQLVPTLGLLDSTMIVAGSMIGSGIFIVSADISRQVGAPGWLLLVWIVTGLLTLMAALSYGELAAMMPHAGG